MQSAKIGIRIDGTFAAGTLIAGVIGFLGTGVTTAGLVGFPGLMTN